LECGDSFAAFVFPFGLLTKPKRKAAVDAVFQFGVRRFLRRFCFSVWLADKTKNKSGEGIAALQT